MNQDKFASLPDFVRAALARKVAQSNIIDAAAARTAAPVPAASSVASTDYRSRVQRAIDESDELECDDFEESILIDGDTDGFSVGTE